MGSWRHASMGRWLMAAAILGMAWPAPGQAQLLKKLKEQVDKATADKPAAEQASPTAAAAPQRSAYNDHVLELTPEVAVRFERALAAEDAALAEFRKYAANVKTQEQYEKCQLESMMGAEGQKLTAEYVAAMEGKEGDAALQAMQAHGQKLEQLLLRLCGPRPGDLDERRREALQAAAETARTAGGFTGQQYAVLKERLVPVCGTPLLDSGDGGLKVPGDGANIFWVYSATEVEVLKQKCTTLQAAAKKLL